VAVSQPSSGDGPRRWFDVAAASVLLVVALPLLAISAVAILLDSGGPVFFGHMRVGRGGRLFRCWKLRTMVLDAEERLEHEPELRRRYLGNGYKIPADQDPRITFIGRQLRRSYLDELPQLFNVLNGSMSLVGPRPIIPGEMAEYGDRAAGLLSVRPGVFGAWTVRGRERPNYPERAVIELEYVRRRSFGRDLVILLQSVPVVLRGQER
jgi:lipopolysaccharide/colanic/teichoic acid biosynthesis glycosyltransferase